MLRMRNCHVENVTYILGFDVRGVAMFGLARNKKI